MGPKHLSVKFRYIVIVAFLGSMVLAGITLFSFEKFTKTFDVYRQYDGVTLAINRFQAHVIKQNYLVAHYIDFPQNKMIRALEEVNQASKGALQSIFDAIQDTDLVVAFKDLEKTFEKNEKGLESLFIADAERAGRRQDLLSLYYRAIQYFHYIDQLEPTQQLMKTLTDLTLLVDQQKLTHYKADVLAFDLEALKFIEAFYGQDITETQKKVVEQVQPILLEFVKQLQELKEKEDQEKARTKSFDDVYAATILAAIHKFSEEVESKQTQIYDAWRSKNAFTRHSMEFAALFTIVSLCWLMVGLSQLFSLRR